MLERQAVNRSRRVVVLALTLFVGAFWMLAGFWSMNPRLGEIGALFPGNSPAEELTPDRMLQVARRSTSVFRDTQATWSATFRDELQRPFAPAQLVYFNGQTPSPCAGTANAAGPFYCEITRTASLDLTFLESLGRYMHRQGDVGAALFIARVMATHVQSELGSLRVWEIARRTATRREQRELDLVLALEADCLTGVWAHKAAGRIGTVNGDFFGHLIVTAREVAWARPAGAVLADEALLMPGNREARSAAFNLGRESGRIRDCAPPV